MHAFIVVFDFFFFLWLLQFAGCHVGRAKWLDASAGIGFIYSANNKTNTKAEKHESTGIELKPARQSLNMNRTRNINQSYISYLVYVNACTYNKTQLGQSNTNKTLSPSNHNPLSGFSSDVSSDRWDDGIILGAVKL